MMTAGSPGVRWRSANTATATTPMTGMVAASRRRISGSMDGSGDLHVPEERRDELQDALHVLAERGGQHVLAPRHVRDLVEGDPLDLVGELLAPHGLGGAHEVGDE